VGRRLVIDYVLEGLRRGYNFVTPTQGIDEVTLAAVWRSAMPRGQGWNAPQYVGARSLKCFPLDDKTVALSEVTVTDSQDEQGRRGIRRAVIDILAVDACYDGLHERLEGYPAVVQAQLARRPTLGQWKRIIDAALPKVRGDAQVVLSHSYSTAEDWAIVEAFVVKLALSRRAPLSRWGKIPPFTTLALETREEAQLVALPSQVLRQEHMSEAIPIL
jgi:hypothetical protein